MASLTSSGSSLGRKAPIKLVHNSVSSQSKIITGSKNGLTRLVLLRRLAAQQSDLEQLVEVALTHLVDGFHVEKGDCEGAHVSHVSRLQLASLVPPLLLPSHWLQDLEALDHLRLPSRECCVSWEVRV